MKTKAWGAAAVGIAVVRKAQGLEGEEVRQRHLEEA